VEEVDVIGNVPHYPFLVCHMEQQSDRYSVNSLEELITTAEEILGWWNKADLTWRGQSQYQSQQTRWTLVPRVLREEYGLTFERSTAPRFKQRAPSVLSDCPGPEDYARWIFLMQHHGLPTRLLDWSRSVLVGAYFAVCEIRNEEKAQKERGEKIPDAVIWVLHPAQLNEQVVGVKNILESNDPRVGDLFKLPFTDFGDKAVPVGARGAVAVAPDYVDPRMVMQHSAFTLHGDRTPLEDHPGHEKFLKRITIPAEKKRRLYDGLRFAGIREFPLFPDLDGLARDLESWPWGRGRWQLE
jgi:hypothetical protein